MASNTNRLGLLKKDPVADGNDTFNIKTMLNDNWDKIDAKVATLGPDGKVPAEQLSVAFPPDATTSQKGVVMLDDSTSSASTAKAATANSVKSVNDSLASHSTDLVTHGVYGTASGTNTLTMTLGNVPAYVEGMLVAFKNTTANTGAATLNINTLGAKSIKKANGNTLTSGSLKAGGIYQLRYDGSNFILLGEGGEYGTATALQVLKGYTVGTENGIVNGLASGDPVNTFFAGNTWIAASAVSGSQGGPTVPTKRGEIKVNKSGVIRVSFELAGQTTSSYAYGQIYKNGVAVGVQRSTNSPQPSYITYTEDITVTEGDLIQLYVWQSSSYYVYAQNFKIGMGNTFPYCTVTL